MSTVRLAPFVAVLVLAGCGGDDQSGSPDVYARISSLTDCSALQQEFDQAEANRSISRDPSIQTSYMVAADERMREVGCYR